MPMAIRWISEIFPITHFLIILRGIIVKGVSINYLWQATLTMLALNGLLIIITAVKFTKKLD